MRSVAAALIIAAVIITGGAYINSRIDSVTEDMDKICAQIKTAAENGDIISAKEKFLYLSEKLEKNHALIASTMDHSELLNIESAAKELEIRIDLSDADNAAIYAGLLGFYLEHLPRNYRLSLENIM